MDVILTLCLFTLPAPRKVKRSEEEKEEYVVRRRRRRNRDVMY